MGNQSAYSSAQTYIKGQQVIVDDVLYQATRSVPVNTSPPNGSFWDVVAITPSGPGGVASVVAGTDVTIDDTDPANPVVSVTDGVLQLVYNAIGPFSVPVWSVPAGWDGTGNASLGATLTTGDALVTGLLDTDGNPIPDGYVFPALIFVEDSTIFDIVMMSSYTFAGGGVAWYGSGGGLPSMAINANEIFAPGLPNGDPSKAGSLYVGAANALFQSAG